MITLTVGVKDCNECQKVTVDACFNGNPATDANIVKGVQSMVEKALMRLGKRK